MQWRVVAILVAISTGALSAQYPVLGYGNQNVGWGWFGSNSVFAGYSAYWQFSLHWAVDVTCDPVTSRCDSGPDYVFTGRESIQNLAGVYFTSTGTAPTGLYTIYGGVNALYSICDLAGTSFTLRRAFSAYVSVSGATLHATSSAPDFTANLETGRDVLLNGEAYPIQSIDSPSTLTLATTPTDQPTTMASGCAGAQQMFQDAGTGTLSILFDPVKNSYVTSVSGFPAGTAFHWWQTDSGGIVGPQASTAPAEAYFYHGVGPTTLQADIPEGTPPGDYPVSATIAANPDGTGASSTLHWTVHVLDWTPIMSGPGPSSFPTIPGLDAWEHYQTSSDAGQRWCSNPATPTETFAFGVESEVWYYDGARVYYQIADFTNNNAWVNCALNISRQYRDYVLNAKGALPGWRIFSKGLARSFEEAADQKYLDAIQEIGQHTSYEMYGGLASDAAMRETAYALDYYTTQEGQLGQPRSPLMRRTAEFLMGQLLAYTDGGEIYGFQPFFGGLAMEALIDYWQLTEDPRVPYVVKRTLDTIWSSDYDLENHMVLYSAFPDGPFCGTHTEWFFDLPTGCNNPPETTRVLNNLISPAFAWYWRLTGDNTYLAEGDDLFAHTLDGGAPATGKQFSQIYRWSFDYVFWRSPADKSTGTRRGGARR